IKRFAKLPALLKIRAGLLGYRIGLNALDNYACFEVPAGEPVFGPIMASDDQGTRESLSLDEQYLGVELPMQLLSLVHPSAMNPDCEFLSCQVFYRGQVGWEKRANDQPDVCAAF